jgi:penicillin amidase
MAYVGMPAVMFGRNERIAWGCTNNICSQRDVYEEKTDPQHPDCFLFDGRWEPARRLEEVIAVKGGPAEPRTITFSRNGPIVDEVLPPGSPRTAPVSLRWLGAHEGGWLTALLAMDRAQSAAQLREATRPWHVPTFSVVFADVDGHIGYQAAGRIPIRDVPQRGYRPGWDPRHQWQGLVPLEGMPHWLDPPRGWVATANNRPAPDDYPYPLSGCWGSGLRAERIGEMLEAVPRLSREDFVAMQYDTTSLRARRCLPPLLRLLEGSPEGRVAEAVHILQDWDCRMEADRAGATLFEVFFGHWMRTAIRERFAGAEVAVLADSAPGLAAALLIEDAAGWFPPGRREPAIRACWASTLDWLTDRLGSDPASWSWGRLHSLPLRHFLSGRGELGGLLDHGGVGVGGNSVTVCNAGTGPAFEARSGAGYRLLVDLQSSPPALWAMDGQSQSGHPGSPHYRDQLHNWLEGQYHCLTLEKGAEARADEQRLLLQP